MENIYKIKIKSDPNPRDLYPSERRYSSSIVLGLGVMFLALAATSTLMGTLVVRRLTQNNNITTETNLTEEINQQRLLKKVENDLSFTQNNNQPPNPTPHHRDINTAGLITAAAFLMSLGLFLSGFTGLLAWKQWYVDHNITWFFLSSCFSSVTSSISLLLITLALMEWKSLTNQSDLPASVGLMANIFITSFLGVIWSVLASNIAFKGMKNDYPDDIVVAQGGKKVVSSVKKGNKIGKVVPPDILSNFPKSGKLAKFFRRQATDGNLPKAESNKEYEERVKKFLSGHTEA